MSTHGVAVVKSLAYTPSSSRLTGQRVQQHLRSAGLAQKHFTRTNSPNSHTGECACLHIAWLLVNALSYGPNNTEATSDMDSTETELPRGTPQLGCRERIQLSTIGWCTGPSGLGKIHFCGQSETNDTRPWSRRIAAIVLGLTSRTVTDDRNTQVYPLRPSVSPRELRSTSLRDASGLLHTPKMATPMTKQGRPLLGLESSVASLVLCHCSC